MSGFVNATGTQYFIEGVATLECSMLSDMTAVYCKDDACEKKSVWKKAHYNCMSKWTLYPTCNFYNILYLY